MDDGFGQAVADWAAFYAFTGGSAATLLGLLFVAVSLQFDLFRRREVADIRHYAAFAFASLLGAMAVAGFSLVPGLGRAGLAWPLVAVGVGGIAVGIRLLREWATLNPADARPEPDRTRRESVAVLLVSIAPFAGLVVAGALVVARSGTGLPMLAVVQGLFLASAAFASWTLLSHARDDG